MDSVVGCTYRKSLEARENLIQKRCFCSLSALYFQPNASKFSFKIALGCDNTSFFIFEGPFLSASCVAVLEIGRKFFKKFS